MLVSFSHIHMCVECTEYLLFVECGERLFWSSTPELFTVLCTMERNELRGIWSSKVLTTPYPVTLLLATRWSNSFNLLWMSLGGLRVGCVCRRASEHMLTRLSLNFYFSLPIYLIPQPPLLIIKIALATIYFWLLPPWAAGNSNNKDTLGNSQRTFQRQNGLTRETMSFSFLKRS